ncbi:hypothetical protein ACVIIV_002949 [Bradyrhizobium sp. USDA 4354]
MALDTTYRHESRLNREFGRKRFGDEGYAMEELVAELGAAFLSADLGLTPEVREGHASYIPSWINVLKNDQRAIFKTSSNAQRAADFLYRFQAKIPPRPAPRRALFSLRTASRVRGDFEYRSSCAPYPRARVVGSAWPVEVDDRSNVAATHRTRMGSIARNVIIFSDPQKR